MALTPFPRIPLDIAELIIDQTDSFSTLQAYALTCRSFLSRARSHIFRVVFLFHWRMDKYQQLLDVFGSSPEIAQYVREITIHEGSTGQPSFVAHPSLPGMIRKFKNLKTFTLGCDRADWNDLTNDLKDSFATILSLGIRKLFLANIYNLPRALSSYIMNIEDVTLTITKFGTQEDSFFPTKLLLSGPQDILPPKSLALSRILMRYSQTLVKDLLSLNYSLVTLSLAVAGWNGDDDDDDTFDIGLNLINKHHRTLTTLKLNFSTASAVESKDVVSRLDMGVLSHLQILEMDMVNTPNSVNTAQGILSNVRQQNEIREITLGFWTDLDILLSGPTFERL